MKTVRIKAGNKILCIKDCRGFSSIRGLMFDSLADKDGALIHANSIWTPFCMPLDLYFLDEHFAVIEKMSSLPLTLNPKTWKVYTNRKAKYCLELKKGVVNIKKSKKIRFL